MAFLLSMNAICKPLKIVTWAGGTDEEICAMVQAADEGKINLSDYWTVGDERTVHLSAMAATGVGESHVEQDVTMVLMDTACTGFTLASATAGGKTNPDFIVGLKNILLEKGYMNSSDTNANGWSGCARRTWCNDVFKNSMPSTLLPIFKQFKWKQGQGGGTTSGLLETTDYFGLAPAIAVFGSTSYSQADEAALYAQWEWYKTVSNKIKRQGDTGPVSYWWECSPRSGGSRDFCLVSSSGGANINVASYTDGLAPFGCI
nr:MAG TPA: hypothetical protein [Caudoviricetes sp.]